MTDQPNPTCATCRWFVPARMSKMGGGGEIVLNVGACHEPTHRPKHNEPAFSGKPRTPELRLTIRTSLDNLS